MVLEITDATKNLLMKLDDRYNIFKITKKTEKRLLELYEASRPFVKNFSELAIKKSMNDFRYTYLNNIIIKAIGEVEKYTELKGKEKKELVIDLIVLLIEKELVFLNGTQKLVLVTIVEAVLPPLIDSLIAMTKTMKHSSKFKKFRRKLFRVITCRC